MELYIHIPFCMKKCLYCDFLSGVYNDKTQKMYTAALCKELAVVSPLAKGQSISSIYIGGGTPSWLDEEDMVAIMDTVYKYYSVDGDAEVSIECNPGTLSASKLKAYRNSGIDRISIGLQSANNDELALLGRVHDYSRFLYTFDAVRKAGFNNVNVDIMTGLPHSTIEKLDYTLRQVYMLRPEHISAYSLIIEEGTPFYDKYKFDAVKQHAGMPTEELPTDEEAYNMYRHGIDFLTSRGYVRYEISNFARTKDLACRHNVGYWDRVPYIGVGLGAASLLPGDVRCSNTRDIYQYIDIASKADIDTSARDYCVQAAATYGASSSVDNFTSPFWDKDTVTTLSRQDAMEEFMFLGLRKTDGVSRQDFENYFGCEIDGVYGNIITALKSQGFIESTAGRIFLTDLGMDLSNQVMAQFLFDK